MRGLPPLRVKWICDRGDVEKIEGRKVQPIDDGWLSEEHAEVQSRKRRTPNAERLAFNGEVGRDRQPRRKPLRASANHPVTQLWYARQGIVTPEMEFIAIRENMGRQAVVAVSDHRNGEDRHSEKAATEEIARNDLAFVHRGEALGANIPREIT